MLCAVIHAYCTVQVKCGYLTSSCCAPSSKPARWGSLPSTPCEPIILHYFALFRIITHTIISHTIIKLSNISNVLRYYFAYLHQFEQNLFQCFTVLFRMPLLNLATFPMFYGIISHKFINLSNIFQHSLQIP